METREVMFINASYEAAQDCQPWVERKLWNAMRDEAKKMGLDLTHWDTRLVNGEFNPHARMYRVRFYSAKPMPVGGPLQFTFEADRKSRKIYVKFLKFSQAA